MTLDEIVGTKDARTFLMKHEILPSQWGLTQLETDRIGKSGVRIVIFNAPASVDMFPTTGSCLMILDAGPLNQGLITAKMQIGIILHELGHLVNPPPNDTDTYVSCMGGGASSEDEIFADDYALHCGYGREFAEALKLMSEQGIYGFDSPGVRKRIERLEQKLQNHPNS